MKRLRSNLQERIAFLKLKSGDSDAFAFFYDKYVSRIYRYVFIKVSNQQIAEDLTQDIFLKVWQYMVDKRNIKSFQAFVFRIARNSVIDHYRQSDKQELPLEYMPDSEEIADEKQSSSFDKSLDAQALLIKIKTMKPEYQEVLLLKYLEDLSIDDIAQVIQKDKNNVRVILHRATKKLKKITEEK